MDSADLARFRLRHAPLTAIRRDEGGTTSLMLNNGGRTTSGYEAPRLAPGTSPFNTSSSITPAAGVAAPTRLPPPPRTSSTTLGSSTGGLAWDIPLTSRPPASSSPHTSGSIFGARSTPLSSSVTRSPPTAHRYAPLRGPQSNTLYPSSSHQQRTLCTGALKASCFTTPHEVSIVEGCFKNSLCQRRPGEETRERTTGAGEFEGDFHHSTFAENLQKMLNDDIRRSRPVSTSTTAGGNDEVPPADSNTTNISTTVFGFNVARSADYVPRTALDTGLSPSSAATLMHPSFPPGHVLLHNVAYPPVPPPPSSAAGVETNNSQSAISSDPTVENSMENLQETVNDNRDEGEPRLTRENREENSSAPPPPPPLFASSLLTKAVMVKAWFSDSPTSQLIVYVTWLQGPCEDERLDAYQKRTHSEMTLMKERQKEQLKLAEEYLTSEFEGKLIEFSSFLEEKFTDWNEQTLVEAKQYHDEKLSAFGDEHAKSISFMCKLQQDERAFEIETLNEIHQTEVEVLQAEIVSLKREVVEMKAMHRFDTSYLSPLIAQEAMHREEIVEVAQGLEFEQLIIEEEFLRILQQEIYAKEATEFSNLTTRVFLEAQFEMSIVHLEQEEWTSRVTILLALYQAVLNEDPQLEMLQSCVESLVGWTSAKLEVEALKTKEEKQPVQQTVTSSRVPALNLAQLVKNHCNSDLDEIDHLNLLNSCDEDEEEAVVGDQALLEEDEDDEDYIVSVSTTVTAGPHGSAARFHTKTAVIPTHHTTPRGNHSVDSDDEREFSNEGDGSPASLYSESGAEVAPFGPTSTSIPNTARSIVALEEAPSMPGSHLPTPRGVW